MKKTLFYSFILAFILATHSSAQQKPVVAPITPPKEAKAPVETTASPTIDSLTERKAFIEAELQTTIDTLGYTISRTQTITDLIKKNNKDTSEASKYLLSARTSLQNATESFTSFKKIQLTEEPILRKNTTSLSSGIDTAPEELKDLLDTTELSLIEAHGFIVKTIERLKASLLIKSSQ